MPLRPFRGECFVNCRRLISPELVQARFLELVEPSCHLGCDVSLVVIEGIEHVRVHPDALLIASSRAAFVFAICARAIASRSASESAPAYALIDPWEHDTDEPQTPGGIFLYEATHRWYDQYIWSIILTPNYNAAHDNHFHVDLTPGSHYIGWFDGRYIGPAPFMD